MTPLELGCLAIVIGAGTWQLFKWGRWLGTFIAKKIIYLVEGVDPDNTDEGRCGTITFDYDEKKK